MNGMLTGILGAVGSVAFFSCIAFCVWLDYRKKAGEREVAHQERMKALELGHTLPDAEIARANAYASAAWAAGVIGLVVPITLAVLATVGTIVAVVHREPWDNIGDYLIVAWSITGVIILVTILRSLNVIRQLPRPTADGPAHEPVRDGRPDSSPGGFQKKPIEL